MRSWEFYFSGTPDDNVGDGEIRGDTGPPYVGRLMRLYVDNLDRDGQYIRPMIRVYPRGTVVYVEGAGETYAIVNLVHAPIAKVGYLELPIVTVGGSPAGIAPGPVTVSFLSSAGDDAIDAVGQDANDDPLLVTITTAKDHLRITDDLHDDDVTQKLKSASATIRDYLKGQNDPTWDDTTAPPWIQAAVLLLLAHLYEHRGDEFGAANDNDDRVWTAIRNLTRRSRDPALA